MSNIIVQQVAVFLKDFLPFSYLPDESLEKIANSIRVLNLNKNKTLFKINDSLHDCFYVVASGVIHLTVISDAEETLLNKCYAGDVFGLRPFFAKNNYQMTAKAREESIVYAIPITTFKPFVAQNSDILDFLLESFTTNTKSGSLMEQHGLISDNIDLQEKQFDALYFQSLSYTKKPIVVPHSTIIKDSAQLVTNDLQDCVLITENGTPKGIATDKDFRSKVATGKVAFSNTIDKIMVAPVITVSESISVAEAQLIMLKHDVTHLCVTNDGTDQSEIKGIISEHDLVVAQANNPGVLLKEIKRAQNGKELKLVRNKLDEIIQTSLNKNIPLTHINSIAGEITLALIRRSIELAILDLGSPPVPFAWLCIGSQGRKEQLLLTDQDSILIFDDVTTDRYRDVRDYFLKLAKKATNTLEKVGYPICQQGHIAGNMLWCKSLTDWTKQYVNWMKNPGEKSNEISSVFFDYEIAFGDQKIEDSITDIVFNSSSNNQLFFDYLGNDAIKKPAPLNFFKKFNLEEDGEFKGKFDIKTRALMPLIDSARLLVLSMGIRGINSTYLRYKQLAMLDAKFSEVYLNCAEAFLVLSKFRALEGIKNDDNGQYINLDELSKPDKERLKNALMPMRDLEEVIKGKFQLTQFS
jgi:CBS domain-containing protein